MLKICRDSIYALLEMIFKEALLTGVFLSEWKKEMLFQFPKNATNKISSSFFYMRYAVKFLKDSSLTKRLTFFTANNLISKNQSGFKPGDSCINQLLSITHKVFTSFDNGLEVRSLFLDVSKGFDKV